MLQNVAMVNLLNRDFIIIIKGKPISGGYKVEENYWNFYLFGIAIFNNTNKY
jgi:hypothetical protein